MKNFLELLNTFWTSPIDTLRLFLDKGTISLGVILSGVFYITGGEDKLMSSLLVVMGIDFFTGYLKAIVKKNPKLDSKIGFAGFIKKVTMVCIIILVKRADIFLEIENFKYNCRFVTISFYFANEGLSILENAINIGLPVPRQIKNLLEQCKEREIKKE